MSNLEKTERDPEQVRAMFERVARRYDLANHLLSGGLDFWWRERAAAIVREWRPRRLLDLATGSGDLALTMARKLPEAEITGADFSPAMLAVARRIPVIVGHDVPGQVMKAGQTLELHPPPQLPAR